VCAFHVYETASCRASTCETVIPCDISELTMPEDVHDIDGNSRASDDMRARSISSAPFHCKIFFSRLHLTRVTELRRTLTQ
jgi:hypothetical protein